MIVAKINAGIKQVRNQNDDSIITERNSFETSKFCIRLGTIFILFFCFWADLSLLFLLRGVLFACNLQVSGKKVKVVATANK